MDMKLLYEESIDIQLRVKAGNLSRTAEVKVHGRWCILFE